MLVVLVIIAILMIYIAGNIRTLGNVGKELKLIDQRQVHRLETRSKNTQIPTSKNQGDSTR